MTTTVTRRYHFAAAHFLPKVHDGHKCKRVHGHNYEVEITVSGPIKDNGFIVDFWDLDKIVDPVIYLVDHRTLNDVPGLENPTAEIIAQWFLTTLYDMTHGKYFSITSVRVYEEKDCWAEVTA